MAIIVESLIELKNVSFAYDEGKMVLNDLDLTIHQGEFIAVLGHNGSGKSTLAKLLNGILEPTNGSVTVDGILTTDATQLLKIRKIVGMVFQNPDNQIVATTVEEDTAFALENLGVEPAEIRRRVDEALIQVDMYQYCEHPPHKLSGGQKQRVAIAGIIAMHPRCIVLDEPTAMLDPRGRKEVIRTITELNQKHNITVVLVTHYMDEAALAKRVIVMDNGKIIMDDTPRQVFGCMELLKSVGLDVPPSTELYLELAKTGQFELAVVLNPDECAKKISQQIS